jgi:ParB family chromosome partitioning protein
MAQVKKRLGRGLDSLVASTRIKEIDSSTDKSVVKMTYTTVDKEVTSNSILDIPINKITCNPHQPRQLFDEEKLAALTESIKSNGLIQPILVRPMADGYQLIAGERRMRATHDAGHKTISAIVRHADEEKMVEWALIENIHRSDLNSLERARAYQHYTKEFSLTQLEAAERLGEERSTLANYIRLLELPDDIQQMVNENLLSMGHARALLALSIDQERSKFAKITIEKNWSVRELERQVQRLKYSASETPLVQSKAPHIQELEQSFTRQIGTKVTINPVGKKGHRGKIVIEYYSLDDFEKIREQLLH